MDKLQVKTKTYSVPKKEGGGTSNITYKITGTDIGGDLNVKSLNANRIMAEYIEANNLQATNGNFVYIVASDGTISTLRGDSLNYNTANIGDLNANNITTNKLKVTDTATIENIFNNYLNSKEIVTDYLTVNKSAHFFEVIIDKIKSVGGTIINTATSCVLDYVKPYNADGETTFDDQGIVKYRCYWKRYANENSQDKKDEVTNDWLVNDQAISQNCNLVSGVNHDAGNHYYWRLVEATSKDNPVYVNFDTGQVWEEKGIPTYQIKFSGHEAETEEDATINAGFTYDNGETNTEDQPDAQLIITDWDITPVSGIETDWDDTEKIFTVKDTINGLQIVPKPVGINDIVQAPYISKGTFSFATEYPTRLNLFIFYDDETVEYHPAPNVATNIYQIELASVTNTIATRFVITSAEVNVWHLCNWIDLSNKDKDAPTHLTGTFDDAPRAGDNVCQLGYRYTELSSSDLIDLRYNSSKTDTAGQSLTTPYSDAGDKQAWKDAHVDEVSRASAIIIAAYKTPDAGGTINGRIIQPIKPIVPPSYAQYQGIITFELAKYRKTYMDATGAYIMGKLVSESGTEIDIEDGLTVDTEYYQIISNENPIVKPSSGTKTVEFRILHVKNGVGSILAAADLTDFNLYANSSKLSKTSNYFTYQVSSSTAVTQLDIQLKKGTTLKDEIILSIIDFGTVIDGKNGTSYELKYKNAKEKPSDSEDRTTANGWYDTATTPDFANGYYTWMSQRNSYYDSVGNYKWTNWTPAIRITGDNGQKGEDGNPGTAGRDGNFTEFIFARTTGSTPPIMETYTGTSQYVITEENQIIRWYDFDEKTWRLRNSPDYIPPSSAISTTTLTTIWTDDPVGPDSTNRYEWVATREYDGLTKTFSGFTTPTVWAIYAENGQQGDKGDQGDDGTNGQEDTINLLRGIFEVRINENSYSTVTAYENITGNVYADIIVAVKHTDGTNSTYLTDLSDYSLELNTDNTEGTNSWTSTTTVHITVDGKDSSTTSQYHAIRFNSTNILSGTPNQKNYYYLHKNGLTSRMPTKLFIKLKKNDEIIDTTSIDLIFKPDHIFSVGETQLNSIYQGLSGKTGVSWTTGFSQIHQDWQNINLSVSNIRKASTLQYPSNTNNQEYAWQVNRSTYSPSAPTTITYTGPAEAGYWTTSSSRSYLDSTYNGHFMSTRTRDSYFGSDGTLKYNSWSSWAKPVLFATYTGGVATTINSAQLDITADAIKSEVSRTYQAKGNYVTYSSTLLQTAEQISAHVYNNVDGDLKDTGIDIENGQITLTADNTTFNGNVQVKGDIEAGIYKGLTYINTETNTYIQYTYDTNNGVYHYSNYVFNANWLGLKSIQLPPAGKVEGMELNIYRYAQNGSWGMLRVQFTPGMSVVLPANSNGNFMANYQMFSQNSYGYIMAGSIADPVQTFILPTLNASAHIFKDTSNYKYVQIVNNQMVTFKAMNGIWYLIRGAVSNYS